MIACSIQGSIWGKCFFFALIIWILKLNIKKTNMMTSGPITSWQIQGETMETVTDFLFLVSKVTVDGDCSHGIRRQFASWQESYSKPRQCVKKQRHDFPYKGSYSQGYDLSSSHVWKWELDSKEGRAPKNWCFWTAVLEKTLESPLDCKERSVLNALWKDWWWSWNSNTLATRYEELTNLKRPWCWERLKVGGEGDSRWWNGWMAKSHTQLGDWMTTNLFFHWSTAYLQCCGNLFCTAKWLRYICVCVCVFFSFLLFSIMAYPRTLNVVPYAIQ